MNKLKYNITLFSLYVNALKQIQQGWNVYVISYVDILVWI